MQGGREKLKRRGIELRTIFTRERFGREGVEDVKDKDIGSIPLTDEIVPLTKEEEKELESVFGKETVKIMKEGVITLFGED